MVQEPFGAYAVKRESVLCLKDTPLQMPFHSLKQPRKVTVVPHLAAQPLKKGEKREKKGNVVGSWCLEVLG